MSQIVNCSRMPEPALPRARFQVQTKGRSFQLQAGNITQIVRTTLVTYNLRESIFKMMSRGSISILVVLVVEVQVELRIPIVILIVFTKY